MVAAAERVVEARAGGARAEGAKVAEATVKAVAAMGLAR